MTEAAGSDRGRVLAVEALGAVFMVLAGSALHFVFDWTGRWPPVAVFAAVNESVFEHLKLAFWPGIVWAGFSQGRLDVPAGRYFAAKGFSLCATAVLIVAVFVGYTRVLEDNLLALDIGTFVLAVILGQCLCCWLILGARLSSVTVGSGLTLLGLQLIAYGLLSYFPPDMWLFIDSGTGLRGISAR